MPPPRGDGLCFERASSDGIHDDFDDSSLEKIDVEVLDPNSTCFRLRSRHSRDFEDRGTQGFTKSDHPATCSAQMEGGIGSDEPREWSR